MKHNHRASVFGSRGGRRVHNSVRKLKTPTFAAGLMYYCSEIADAANYHHSDGSLVLLHFSNYSQLANLILLTKAVTRALLFHYL